MTTEYLPTNAARVQGKIDMLDVSEQAIANVDQALTWVGLKTYTQLCDQLAELAEVAIRDNGRLEQQIVELRRELAEAHNADLLAAAEALLDRLDTMTTEEFRHGGEREQRESLRAEVQKSKLEASK